MTQSELLNNMEAVTTNLSMLTPSQTACEKLAALIAAAQAVYLEKCAILDPMPKDPK